MIMFFITVRYLAEDSLEIFNEHQLLQTREEV